MNDPFHLIVFLYYFHILSLIVHGVVRHVPSTMRRVLAELLFLDMSLDSESEHQQSEEQQSEV